MRGEPTEFAHRLAWRLSGRELIRGRVLDHVCNNTLCVNPDHLDQITQSENLLRKRRRRPVETPRPFWSWVGEFITETCDFGPALGVLRKVLYARWCEWAKAHGINPSDPAALGRALTDVVDIEDCRVRIGGKQQWCYRGLALKGETG